MKTISGMWRHLVQLTILIFLSFAASAQLQADFAAPVTSGCPPLVVNFIDSSKGNPVEWKWDLGNGTISYLQNPTAAYFASGSYNVKLVVKDANGYDSIAKSDFIVVNALPVPNFGYSDSSGCYPFKVQFSDSSTAGSGSIESWQWDFGDGTLSNERNPVHTYTNAGIFTVILSIINSNGCSKVITRSGLIQVQSGINANFSYTSPSRCHSPTPVYFKNETTSTGPVTYQWDFGNGGTSEEQNPVFNYKDEGVYTVKLVTVNMFGCTDTIIKNNAVDISFAKADFLKPDIICADNPFQLKNTSSPSTYVKAQWHFGDDSGSTNANPSYTYAKPGVYNAKLVMDFGSCLDSILKPITVLASPTAGFTATNNTGCTAPLTVNFTSTSAGAIAYEWSFGDGQRSTLQNPEHAYAAAGEYAVTLTITNESGCTSTLIKQKFVKIIPPKIRSIKNLPFNGCIPATVSPIAVLNDSLTITAYLWEFGDGTTSTDAKPSHIYNTAGEYSVKLTITAGAGCIDTLTLINAVKVGAKPKAALSADPRDACAFSIVNFSDLSSGATAEKWLWTFGDGGTSELQNPARPYNDTGYFDVSLIVWNFGCSDTAKKERYIHVRPPVASFDTSFFCNDPLKRQFINKSIGATAWEWSFGDGSTSAAEAPSHTYIQPGTYEVILKVTNGSCEHMQKKDVIVIKEKPVLQANLSESCLNTRIIFNVSNIDAANILTYTWYFNGLSDYGVTTSNNPVASSYNTPGSRIVAAIITDLQKCRDTIYTASPVSTYGVKAAFGAAVTGTCFGNTIKFSDSTKTDGIHPVANWNWSFGEGDSQEYTSATTFSHDYSATGTYNVKLIVTDTYGCKDSVSKPAYISISRSEADFTPSDTLLCPSTPVTFTNKSKGLEVKYQWTFGDGTTSNDYSPVHTYLQPGSFIAKMLMIDKNGCRDSLSVTINVFTATADFSLSDSFSTCPPLVVNITNKSSNYTTHFWDFGDGGNSKLVDPSHIYTFPGSYTVTLVVKNNGGCTDTLVKSVKILGPKGLFGYVPTEVCKPATINYQVQSEDAVKYVWDFNDGNTVFNSQSTVSHTYITAGRFLPKVILEDAGGCKVAITGIDTVKVNEIETHILSNETVVCDSGFIAFKDSTITNDILSGWFWDFGDGTTSTLMTPTHRFQDTGNYTITLTATSKTGCTSTAKINNYIKVLYSPDIRISGDTAACSPGQLDITGEFVRQDTSKVEWSWDFGNGEQSDLKEPPVQKYGSAGSYFITLKATNSDGCSNTVSRQISIHPNPVVNAGPDTIICKSKSLTLSATGASEYTWTSNPSLTCTNCQATVAKPDKLATYYVSGKTQFGCSGNDSVTVRVKQPFSMTVSKGDTVCVGETVVLNVVGADFYKWQPSLWLDNPDIAKPRSTPDTTITYRVTGKDSLGCFSDSASITLKVYPKPKIEITNGEAITVQIGSDAKIGTKASSDVTRWRWNPQQWLSCATCSEPRTSAKDNITYSVVATNEGNCEAEDKITVNVICSNANVYIPNTFSPNGDGMNDNFYPRGSGLYNIKSFKIFNRWGQVVFAKDGISANNPAHGWDGTLNGVKLPTDVYVYILEVICANNKVFPFKGNVSLIR